MKKLTNYNIKNMVKNFFKNKDNLNCVTKKKFLSLSSVNFLNEIRQFRQIRRNKIKMNKQMRSKINKKKSVNVDFKHKILPFCGKIACKIGNIFVYTSKIVVPLFSILMYKIGERMLTPTSPWDRLWFSSEIFLAKYLFTN